VLDEIFLRESISVNTKSLNYHGLEDFVEGLDIERRASEIYEGFTDCEETYEFIDIFNNIFDALNRKFPGEGIRKNSCDLEVYYILCGVC